MPSQEPPPSSPAGVPSSGSAKYIAVAVVLLGAVGAAIVTKPWEKPAPPPVVVEVDAGPPAIAATGGRDLDDEIPLPPPVQDAEPEPVKKAATRPAADNQCDAKACSGSAGPELETAIQHRVRLAHGCYNTALEHDSTLQGRMTVSVRIGANGRVCSSKITTNDMGSDQVASCVESRFRGASLPSPKGGCVDVNVPIHFVAGR